MKKIKALIKTLEKLVEVANAAEEAYAANPDNEKLEAAFDEAYKAEYETRQELTKAISSFAGIDSKTAYTMTNKTFEQLKSLTDRI